MVRARKDSEFSTSSIHDAVLRAIAAQPPPRGTRYLDIGSGTGLLMTAVEKAFAVEPFAADYTDRWMKRPEQKVAIVDLDREPLPFPDREFSLVTCVETIEHVENFRAVVREAFRVLEPGGHVVFTTPNVLNLRSRIRYLTSGFYNLFCPVLLDRPDVRPGARGHMSPSNFISLAYTFVRTGFTVVRD